MTELESSCAQLYMAIRPTGRLSRPIRRATLKPSGYDSLPKEGAEQGSVAG